MRVSVGVFHITVVFFVCAYTLLLVLLSVGSATLPSSRPFRRYWAAGMDSVMDEFDIFMDAVSRNAAMKQVLAFAKAHCVRQFILITPQVRHPPLVSILPGGMLLRG